MIGCIRKHTSASPNIQPARRVTLDSRFDSECPYTNLIFQIRNRANVFLRFSRAYIANSEREGEQMNNIYSGYLQSTVTPFVLKSFFASVIS